MSVERLLDDLWAGEPPPRALASLQAYVSRLRSLLEPDRRPREPATVLRSQAPGYVLDLPVDAVDVWAFSRDVRRARELGSTQDVLVVTEAALAAWDEPFEAFADEEWARPEIARLTALRAELVEVRGAALLAEGRLAEAVELLRPHVDADPFRERGIELLAHVLYASGRQVEALELVRRTGRLLVDELGLDPSPLLARVETDLLNGVVVAPVPVAPGPSTGPVAAVEAVRRAELERLVSAARRGGSGPAVVWLAGEAGLGKSFLLARSTTELASHARVVLGRCPEVGDATPGRPWLEVLDALDLATGPSLVTAVEALHGLERPLVVVLEDVHRADGETLQALRRVLAPGRAADLVVVASYRPDEVGDDLAATFAATSAQTIDHLTLRALGPEASARLLRSHLDVDLPSDVEQTVVERAAGNPLFLQQVGRLVVAEGDEGAAHVIPSGVREVVQRRLDRLPAGVTDVLSRAAVLGREVDVDLFLLLEARRGELTEDRVLEALDAGVVSDLLEARTAAHVAFVHSIVRDVLHERIPPLRRARLHGEAMAAVEEVAPHDLQALATHAAAGLSRTTASTAARHLRAAAAQALAAGSPEQAVRHAEAAVAAHELEPDHDPVATLPVRQDLVTALASAGDTSRARNERETTVRLAQRHGRSVDVARSLVWRAPTIWTIREMQTVDERVVDQIRQTLDDPAVSDDTALVADLHTTLSRELEGGPRRGLEAVAAAAQGVAGARRLGDPRSLCRALTAQYLTSFPPAAEGTLDAVGTELLEVARRADLADFEAVAHQVLYYAALVREDLVLAERHHREALSRSSAGQLPSLLGIAGIHAGLRELLAGRLDAAATAYGAVTAAVDATGDLTARGLRLLLDASLLHARGSLAPMLAETQYFDTVNPEGTHELVVAALLDAGDVKAARRRWRPTPIGEDYLWTARTSLRLENAVRLDDRQEAQVRRAELRSWSGRFAGLSGGALVLGPVDLFLGEAAAALGAPGEAAGHLQAARDLADAHGATQWSERASAGLRRLAAQAR
ncbi:MAG: BTAD domain-containing putative transcriptional regulator [Aeromicrobium erythreum]